MDLKRCVYVKRVHITTIRISILFFFIFFGCLNLQKHLLSNFHFSSFLKGFVQKMLSRFLIFQPKTKQTTKIEEQKQKNILQNRAGTDNTKKNANVDDTKRGKKKHSFLPTPPFQKKKDTLLKSKKYTLDSSLPSLGWPGRTAKWRVVFFRKKSQKVTTL